MSKERPFEDITPIPNIKVGYFEKEAYLEIIDRQEKQIATFADVISALQSRIDILEKNQRPKGKWIKHRGYNADGFAVEYSCSGCNEWNDEKSRYCPNCGSKMTKEVEND